VPLHHWLEHKVIHYLSGRRKGGGAAYAKASAARAETVAE
jgi:hypothetical protein